MHSSDKPDSVWRVGTDMDLQAVTALARASTIALLELSPESNRKVREALHAEIAMLEDSNDPSAQAAANLVRQTLHKARA